MTNRAVLIILADPMYTSKLWRKSVISKWCSQICLRICLEIYPEFVPNFLWGFFPEIQFKILSFGYHLGFLLGFLLRFLLQILLQFLTELLPRSLGGLPWNFRRFSFYFLEVGWRFFLNSSRSFLERQELIQRLLFSGFLKVVPEVFSRVPPKISAGVFTRFLQE